MSTVYADLDEIVFEGRAKDYGAYDIRKKYGRILERAALIAFILFIFITAFPKFIGWIMPEPEEEVQEFIVQEYDLSDLELDQPEEDPEPEPEIPPPPPPPAVAQIAFKVPTPAPDEEVLEEVSIVTEEETDTTLIGLENVEGVSADDYNWGDIEGVGMAEIEEPVNDDPNPDDFILLEQEPAPVNMDDIKKLIGYPPMAKEAEIEGKVIVRVLVDKTGKYVKHIVLKDPHPILTRAVTEKIGMLTFTPGIQAGKPIKVWVTIPFDFKLLK